MTGKHAASTRSYVEPLAAECGIGRLSDLHRERLECWLVARDREGMSARSRNAHRDALVTFCNWCVSTERLAVNPFDCIPKANEKADPRRRRRSMNEPELVKVLAVARERPLLDALTIRTGKRKGQLVANVRPEVRKRLALLGVERRLIYKTLVLTGLRKGELSSLTVAHLHLDEAVPFATLAAADEKNREGNDIALRDDLAADLRDWLDDKLRRLQAEALESGRPDPKGQAAAARYAVVHGALAAGQDPEPRPETCRHPESRDDRGRTLDVHALRTTFGTLMSKAGVAPRTAQAAMRHSKIDLTMANALHRPQTARRSRGPRRTAGATPRSDTRRGGSRQGDRHDGKGPEFGCTNGCTNY